MTDHPITPPPELARKWATWRNAVDEESFWRRLATEAARWGADQELEACCEWLRKALGLAMANQLRDARRPKPPSLKEQAQRILIENGTTLDGRMELDSEDIAIIRRALEALDD